MTYEPTIDTADPVGLRDIAERLGLRRQTMAVWRARYPASGINPENGAVVTPFPEPRWEISGVPAWDWEDVVVWLRRTDRGYLIPG